MLAFWRPILLWLLFLVPASSIAFDLRIIPAFILNASAPTQIQSGNSLGWTGSLAPGFGLNLAFPLGDSPIDFESGFHQLNESSSRQSSGQSQTRTARSIHIPALIRFHLDSKFSLATGGYSSTLTSSTSSDLHDRDFGLLFCVRSSFPITSRLDFMIEGRYQHGLTNLANPTPSLSGDLFNSRSMQAHLGMVYRLSLFESFNQSSDPASPGW